ncbi:hypothetical protein HB13667_00880 [Pseudomonas putida]|uniref:Uncharacterized protein n=1 Tax=Pseudomonas putida TaxID=303 RepID=A0A0P7DKB2_PSEPU|nr:hypothetical protein HB13667_00880 [Pseudomonas putida]
MLRTLPLADEQILPQAKQESYFFNRVGQLRPSRQAAIGQKQSSMGDSNRLWIQQVNTTRFIIAGGVSFRLRLIGVKCPDFVCLRHFWQCAAWLTS